MSYQDLLKGYIPASAFSVKPGRRTVLDSRFLSVGEDQDGNVTLALVDMQPGFKDAIDKATLDAAERQIKLAMRRGWAIVLVENAPWDNGRTYPQLRKHLMDGRGNWKYNRACTVIKTTDGGGAQVIKACRAYGYPLQYFRVCGVYLDACVEQTVLGILKRIPGASVRCIREAMNTNYLHEEAWESFPTRPYLVVSSELVDSAPCLSTTRAVA